MKNHMNRLEIFAAFLMQLYRMMNIRRIEADLCGFIRGLKYTRINAKRGLTLIRMRISVNNIGGG